MATTGANQHWQFSCKTVIGGHQVCYQRRMISIRQSSTDPIWTLFYDVLRGMLIADAQRCPACGGDLRDAWC